MHAREQPPSDPRAPLLTFVIPVFDPPADVFGELLDSIAAQSAPDWECLLVNDASTRPDVATTIDARVAADPRFRAIHRRENGGIAAATNSGIDAARGSIIAFADHDDLVDATAVEAILRHFADHPDDDVVYTDERVIDGDGHTIADYDKPDYSPIRHLGHHYLAHMIACRREAIGEIRVRGEYEPAQDVDFVLRVIERVHEQGRSVGHIPEHLYAWRAITGSTALDAGEKPEMCAAVERSIQAAVDRRGIPHRVSTVEFEGKPTTAVRFVLEAVADDDIDVIPIDGSTMPATLADRIAAAERRFVWLRPPGDHPANIAGLLAAEVALDGRAIAGPHLIGATGDLLSAGRVVEPRLADALAGGLPGPGPWGAFLVTREVSALAPWGALLDRRAVAAVGGLPTDVGIDAGFAELSVRLASVGRATVSSPTVQLAVDDALVTDVDPVALDDEWTIARTRLGAVTEHHQANGVAHVLAAQVDVITDARRRILRGEVDLVTSDVFDTLVTRYVARPSDLFVSLAVRLHDAGLLDLTVSPRRFAIGRMTAESLAREPLRWATPDRAPECTLAEIWTHVPGDWLTDREAAMAAELEHEAAHLVVIEPATAVLELARRRGVAVTLVSDIYLTSDQLRTVLVGAGLELAASIGIVTSCDHRLGKADGLLERVIEQSGVDATRVMHLGDNEFADVRTATEIGAQAIAVDLPSAAWHVPARPQGLFDYSSEHATDGGVSAAVRATLLAKSIGHDPAYQFGVAAAGPALAGFARWASLSTERLGASTLHCLLREGARIADLVAVVRPDGPPTRLVHASRWVDMRAACTSGDADEIRCALARRSVVTLDHIHRAFGCDPDVLRSVLGVERIAPSELGAASALLAANDQLRSQIVSASAELRGRVTRLLHEELTIDEGPLVICDVGWGGTIQEGLTRILRADGIDREVIGLYFALSAPGEERLARGNQMFSYLPHRIDDERASRSSRIVSHHADSIERLLTPTTGSLIDVAEDGSPVLDPTPEHLTASLGAAQLGTFDIAARLARQGFDDEVWVDDPAFRAALGGALATVIEQPTVQVASQLGTWRHDDVAGTATTSLAGDLDATLIARLTARDVDAFRSGTIGWVEGLAAVSNPALTAQLAAERAGISLELLVPGSEAGESLLAAFPHGSKLSPLQSFGRLSMHPEGWSVLRISGGIDSVRSIRFDASAEPTIVQLERFRIEISRGSTSTVVDVTDIDAASHEIEWWDTHPIGPRRFASRAGGHIVVPIPAALGRGECNVDVTVIFRRWAIDPADPVLTAPVRHRVEEPFRRVRRRLLRRLGRGR